MTLAVVSADKSFFVRYAIHQPTESRYLTVLGREFPGLPEKRRSWSRVRSPQFTSGDTVTPSDVRRLIEWSLDVKQELVQVDSLGRELPGQTP